MPFTKQGVFTKKPSDFPDVPSPDMTPTEIRNTWQVPLDETRNALNKVVDELNANTAAGNMGAKDSAGATTTVQDLLNSGSSGLKSHKEAVTLDHPDKSVTEAKLGNGSVSRRTIQSGAVGTNELDPDILAQPTTAIGQQAKFEQIDSQLADIVHLVSPLAGVENATSNATLINSALQNSSYTAVKITTPDFYVDDTLLINRSNLRLFSDNVIIRMVDGVDKSIVQVDSAAAPYPSDVVIENLHTIGNKTATTSQSDIAHGIHAKRCDNVIIRNNFCENNMGDGIAVDYQWEKQPTHIIVEENTVKNNGRNGIAGVDFYDLIIRKNEVYDNALDIEPAQNKADSVIVSENTLYNGAFINIPPGSVGTVGSRGVKNAIIKNNIIKNPTTYAVNTGTENPIIIDGNQIETTYTTSIRAYGKNADIRGNSVNGAQILVESAGENNKIRDNKVLNSNGIGIYVLGKHTLIEGNEISKASGRGIYASGIPAVIKHNKVYGCAGEGVQTNGGGCVIDGNEVYNNTGEGIEVFNANGELVVNNKCYDDQTTKTQTYGVKIVSGDYYIVKHNNLRNNATGGLNDAATGTNKFVGENLL